MHHTYRWLLIVLAVAGLAADQSSKYGVFRWLYRQGELDAAHANVFEVVPGWFRLIAQFDPNAKFCDCGCEKLQSWSAPIMPHVNQGALFGMGAKQKDKSNYFFAGVSLVAAVAILVWGLRRTTAHEPWLVAALGLILAGTIGNLYDRLVFNGVRDFLYFYRVEWPVFNVADCCLVLGATLLVVQALFTTPRTEEEKPAGVAEAPAVGAELKA